MSNSKQDNNNDLIYEAIEKGDEETIKTLINSDNIDINEPNEKGITPLYWAIIKTENLEIMKILLANGANIYANNKNSQELLHVAVRHKKPEVVSLLIENGALIGEDIPFLLLKTIRENNHTIFKVLLDNQIQYDPLFNLKFFLDAAVSQRYPKVIEKILPYCQFLKSSEKYISRELIVKHELRSQECIELLLKWDFSVDPAFNRDGDFIYSAVEKGYLPIVLQLLELGIDVRLVNLNTRLNLLKLACLKKHYEIVHTLLKHNAYINLTIPMEADMLEKYHYNSKNINNNSFSSAWNEEDLWDITYLHVAAVHSDLATTKLILNKGSLMMDNPKFFNITCVAVQNNREEIVSVLLDHGFNINHVDDEGKSLLHFCVNSEDNPRNSRFNMAKLLLEKGAAIHLQTSGNSLLFDAVKNGHHKIAQMFMEYNFDIQYINPVNGDTLLHKAIEHNFGLEFIDKLLKLNAPVDAVNYSLLTPLFIACKTSGPDQLEIIKLLLQHNANVNFIIDTALIYSLFCLANPEEDIKKLESFLEKEVSFNNGKKIGGQTPLHFICKYKSNATTSIIELLLEHKANIEAVDLDGWTPLFVACYSNNHEAIKCLLNHNANATHTDKQNLTALYITAKYSRYNSEIIQQLLERKVNVHCMDKQKKSIIHLIVENNNAESIKILAQTQLNFNTIDEEGNTPLHIAVKNKNIGVTRYLIQYGANINIVDKNNQTPLLNAMKLMSIVRNKLEYDRIRRDYRRNSRYFRKRVEKVGINIYNYICDLHSYQEIIKLLKQQVVKLHIAGLKVSQQNRKLVYDPSKYSDYEFSSQDKRDCEINVLELQDNCKQEIEQMKTEYVKDYSISLYCLLNKNIQSLSKYVRNKKIQQTLKQEVYDEKFPSYIHILRSRFRDAKLRYRLANSAKQYFSSNVCSKFSEICLNEVFDYLTIQEIKIFIRALKPINN